MPDPNPLMENHFHDYKLFFDFIETYIHNGFSGIDTEDPLMMDLEQMMAENDQFIYLADAIHMKILYVSKRSNEMMGIRPEDLSFYHFMEATHPDDIQRLNVGRSILLKQAQDIFIKGNGSALLSTNFRIQNNAGKYTNCLMQNYLFYTEIPYKTVLFLKVHTNIDWCKKIKHGYHYYIGNDLSLFRYPDDVMLQKGNVFTEREFEIIKLVASGLSTDQIAEKLFLSIYTINTHRRNILYKTEKANISELILDLKERGVI